MHSQYERFDVKIDQNPCFNRVLKDSLFKAIVARYINL
jgi:hypothetical protein